MTPEPKLFSERNPKLQLAWDATSLYALSFCPRFYQYSILEGWRGSTVDMEFGILAHGAMEVFDRALLAGDTFEKAQFQAVEYALKHSGAYDGVALLERQEMVWKPWGGRYERVWKCAGTEKYKPQGAKGARKCPWARARLWFPAPAPAICGECGSPILEREMWLPVKPGKSRPELIRHIVWWTEEMRNDAVRPEHLANGKPAVEVNFRIRLPFLSAHGEQFWLCGYLDGVCSFAGERFFRERKTTKSGLTKQYWNGFAPNMQIDTYDLAGSAIPEMRDVRGVLIEAGQTLESGSRFGRHVEYRRDAQREEHQAQIGELLRDAERYAESGHWPMHKSQCKFCPFSGICAMEPGKREQFLEQNFSRSRWNPLEER